jgi:threonylcarbamoyladenosine tRNA methylthiotransferase CDKAL1
VSFDLSPSGNNIIIIRGVHQTIYMRTWGCAHNNSDSEYMAGLLSSAGYTISDRPDGADLWLLNSCTVKTPSETQLENQLNAAKLVDVPVVVAGCVSQAAPNTAWLKVCIVGDWDLYPGVVFF